MTLVTRTGAPCPCGIPRVRNALISTKIASGAHPRHTKLFRPLRHPLASWLNLPSLPGSRCSPGPQQDTTSFASPASSDPTSLKPSSATTTSSPRHPPEELSFEVPDWVRERNCALAQDLHGKLILAPLTKGGNLPFRRLCVDLGAEVTMSEMAFSKPFLKGDRVERARLYKADSEQCFGFQIATKTISEGIQCAQAAKEAGARWLDINCGCPIHEATSKGMGAAMLRKPSSLAKMVHGIVRESPLPVTVKIRIGESDKKINVDRVTDLLARAGAAAVIIHGRTMQQRYCKPVDWSLISQVAVATPPTTSIIGNGDILTLFEARRRLAASGCHAVMVGRGALIRPWIYQEMREGREMLLDAAERVGVYRQLVAHMKSHFGDDAMGRRKAWYFLPWHLGFFCRYRPLPEATYSELSLAHPLIMTRQDTADQRLGETLDSLGPVERLLRCGSERAHECIAAVLWDSCSDAEAVAALETMSLAEVAGWEAEVRVGSRGREGSSETAGSVERG